MNWLMTAADRLPTGLIKYGKKAAILWETYGPDICAFLGIGMSVGATVEAVHATTKAMPVIEETKKELEALKASYAGNTNSKEFKRDLTKVYVTGLAKLAKIYGKTAGLEAGSAILSWHGHAKLRDQNNALAASYAAFNEMFKEYRDRVIADAGAEKDLEYRLGLKTEVLNTVDEEGNTVEKRNLIRVGPSIGRYSRVFDERNPFFTGNPIRDMAFLSDQEFTWNQRLPDVGFIAANEILVALGYKPVIGGGEDGWVWDPDGGSHQIDFGLYDYREMLDDPDMIENGGNKIMLDFNAEYDALGALMSRYGSSSWRGMRFADG